MMESLLGLPTTSIGTKIMTDFDIPMKDNGEVDWDAFDKMREDNPICIHHDTEMVSFKMMTKPASEGGKGCQFTDLIEVALHQLKYFDGVYPSDFNKQTIYHLERALRSQELRTNERKSRGVEGKNEV